MRYYLIAGEASGDLHGSNLIRGLRSGDPSAEFRFRGGGLMEAAAGCPPVVHYREGAVMGISDVLARGSRLLCSLRSCKTDVLSWRPDVVILIDYPGFNLKMARFCHGRGLKVFWYIAPKTWASREGRNRKLKAWVDRLFIVFPFEVPYFSQKGIPFIYNGNPLVDAVEGHHFSPVVNGRYVALLPGSRKGEISRMMPVCMQVADRLGLKMVVAGAPSATPEDYAPYIGERKNVEVIFGRTYDLLRYADAAIINSGTASLEAALIGTPQVVCWSSSALTAFVGRRLLRVFDHVKYISLGNLCLDRMAFRELIQEEFTPENVADEVCRLLDNGEYRSRMLSDYAAIRASLGGVGASAKVAEAMIKELKQ